MRIALFVALVAIAPEVAAQQPSATQIQQALQQQPGLADQVRSRISQSGLTPEQIRARLAASGYPASLLDPYLSATAAAGLPRPGGRGLPPCQPLGWRPRRTNFFRFATGLAPGRARSRREGLVVMGSNRRRSKF